MFFLGLAVPLLFAGLGAQAPVPVILDTDIGDDIDDTWALAMLLGCPQADLKLIVTSTNNTPEKARLVGKLLQYMGREDIPLAVGVQTSDSNFAQQDWLGDWSWDSYKGKVDEDGVQALVDAINLSPEPPVLMAIGPLTNLAAALERDPSIAGKCRVVLMAGSVYKDYGGNEGRSAEWNVVCDTPASQAVFSAPWEISITPLDTCGQLRLAGAEYQEVVDSACPRAKAVIENYEAWAHRHHHPADSSSVLFDTVAAYMTFDESLLNMETVKLVVDDKGFTIPDEEKGKPIRCALSWKDEAAFRRLLIESLTHK